MVQQNRTGELLQLSLEGWGPAGEALARYDGKEILVLGGIPGEEVVAEVIRCRRDYWAARVVEVLTASPYRTVAPCPYFGECTGCQWQHVDYQHQLGIKRQKVLDALSRTGGFDAPPVSGTLAAPEQYGYRNHARFTVGRRWGELGFVNRESRRFVPIQRCRLMHPWINQALEGLQGRCAETSQLSLRYGVNTGDFLVQPTLKSEEVPLPSGQKHYGEALNGTEFRVAASSFFQVNTNQARRMVELLKEALQLSGEGLLVDAYAGVGVFAILLAPYAGRVIAIEESASAVRDAEHNAVGLDNITFLQAKTEEALAQMEERPYGVILDPPRAGCRSSALEALIELGPRKVVYVSCDPDTLARDLAILCRGPFSLDRVQPIDMFPQTHHVECVATLSWDGHGPGPVALEPGKGHDAVRIVLASTSPRRSELLSGLGIEFRVMKPSVSEAMEPHETPEEMVERLALAKARSVASSLSQGLIVAADSTVVLDGQVLGKPVSASEATDILRSLRGKEHRVVTGVAVLDPSAGWERVVNQVSVVSMRNYSDEEIRTYVASGEPMDKAGAYAVQDTTFRPAAGVEGCSPNVMGLPLCLLVDLLKDAGVMVGPGDRIQVPDGCSQCPLKDPSPQEYDSGSRGKS